MLLLSRGSPPLGQSPGPRRAGWKGPGSCLASGRGVSRHPSEGVQCLWSPVLGFTGGVQGKWDDHSIIHPYTCIKAFFIEISSFDPQPVRQMERVFLPSYSQGRGFHGQGQGGQGKVYREIMTLSLDSGKGLQDGELPPSCLVTHGHGAALA